MSTTATTAAANTIKSATTYTFRLRPPPGLERTLIKELKTLRIPDMSPPRKIPGRKIIEVTGPEAILWHMMFKSRIAEDI